MSHEEYSEMLIKGLSLLLSAVSLLFGKGFDYYFKNPTDELLMGITLVLFYFLLKEFLMPFKNILERRRKKVES